VLRRTAIKYSAQRTKVAVTAILPVFAAPVLQTIWMNKKNFFEILYEAA